MSSKTPTEQMIKKGSSREGSARRPRERQGGHRRAGKVSPVVATAGSGRGEVLAPTSGPPALQLVSELTLTSGAGGAAFCLG